MGRASAAPGCGGQSSGGPGGGLQVGELAPGCFSWEMGSLWLKWSARTSTGQPLVLAQRRLLGMRDIQQCSPLFGRVVDQWSACVVSVCLGSCALRVAGRPVQG